MSTNKEHLTTSEAAALLGVSLGTIRRWSDEGYLPHWRTPGNVRRFERTKLEEFKDKRENRK